MEQSQRHLPASMKTSGSWGKHTLDNIDKKFKNGFSVILSVKGSVMDSDFPSTSGHAINYLGGLKETGVNEFGDKMYQFNVQTWGEKEHTITLSEGQINNVILNYIQGKKKDDKKKTSH